MRWIALLAAAWLALSPAAAEPAVSPADQARAFLADYFGPEQKPPQRRARRFEDWMTARFAGLYRRAQERGRQSEEPFLEADPILNAQDCDRPGDIRIEAVAGTPDRPAVTVSFRVFADDPQRTTQILIFAEDRGEWRLFDVLTPAEGAEPASLRRAAERYLAQRPGGR